MKCIVSAVFTLSGTGKESNKPYSMTRIGVLVPFQDVDTPNFKNHGQGFNVVEMGVNNNFSTELINKFTSLFKGTPIIMDLTTSLDREAKNVVTGYEIASQQPKAA
jgi:hypothetical protein